MARIMVVNDEPDLMTACAIVLESAGHFAVTIDEHKAVEAVPEVRPDLVLLDVVMPSAHGEEVLLHLREADSQVPVVMMSALADGAALAARVGADAFLAKPFEPDALLHVVAETLRRRDGSGVSTPASSSDK